LYAYRTQALKRGTRTHFGQKHCGEQPHNWRVLVVDENGTCSQVLEKTMNSKWKSSALMLALVLLLSAPAFAREHGGSLPPSGGPSGAAPEVDPGLAIAGISFLTGSLAVLRSRLRK